MWDMKAEMLPGLSGSAAEELEAVVRLLSAMRVGIGTFPSEAVLQEAVARALAGIPHRREQRVAPRCRIDFLTDSGVGIEVKRGKQSDVLPQLERYAAADAVQALVLLTERRFVVPATVGGKPCVAVVLSYLWGVATR